MSGIDDHERRSSDDESGAVDPSRSEVAQRLLRLRRSAFRAAATREHLPQPLFWSLFLGELRELKEQRKKDRKVKAAIFECDWLS